MIESNNPPLLHDYMELLRHYSLSHDEKANEQWKGQKQRQYWKSTEEEEEEEVPTIDLRGLTSEDKGEREACEAAIAKASSEWGFFQVVNHGVSLELLRKMRREQVKLFSISFERKASCGLLNNSYRWGNPTAASPSHFSWSEAFHVPLTKVSDPACYGEFTSLRKVMEEYAGAMQEVARVVAWVLARKLAGRETEMEDEKGREMFEKNCNESTCFLRMNRYPVCPLSSSPYMSEIYGLVPHTDSDFLTILHQDEHAWSNDEYKSVEHKVTVNEKAERYSIAYFLCPSYDTVIESWKQPCVYGKFTFGEYRQQIQKDVNLYGHKLGLSRFLLQSTIN
ncbi:Gibberellin 2-beta-dioxygenase [Bertholletia excelsa]